VTQFADHGIDGAAAQSLLHRPQQIAAVAGGDRQQPLGREVEGIEARAVQRATFGERHVLGDPADAAACRQSERKAGRGGEMGFAGRRDFMQRAACQAAAERLIDGRNAERQAAWIVADPGGFLQSLQALTQLLEHGR